MKPTAQKIRVIIADDHAIFRKGLATILHETDNIDVIAQAADGSELIECARRLQPDVVITDIQMPRMNGIEAAAIIASEFPLTGIIALSIFDSLDSIKSMLKLGAKGYILKNSDSTEIVKAITTVFRQENYFSSSIISRIVAFQLHPADTIEFTKKEMEIIRLICRQYSGKEIASQLNSTIRSVESAKERIQQKTGARNMVGIALYAIKALLIPIADV